MDELLERLVHTASLLTDAERASLFLIDEDGDELWSKVAQGEQMAEIRVPRPAPASSAGPSSNNQLANVEDAYEDERFNRDVDLRTGYRTSTILCAPVRDQNRRVLGALQIINKSIGVFTEEDESLARAVASQAALGIENINLFRAVLTATAARRTCSRSPPRCIGGGGPPRRSAPPSASSRPVKCCAASRRGSTTSMPPTTRCGAPRRTATRAAGARPRRWTTPSPAT